MQPPSSHSGEGGKPLSPHQAVSAKMREMAQIEGAVGELKQLAHALHARVQQLEARAGQLAAEIEKARKGPGLIVTNCLPPTPPLS